MDRRPDLLHPRQQEERFPPDLLLYFAAAVIGSFIGVMLSVTVLWGITEVLR